MKSVDKEYPLSVIVPVYRDWENLTRCLVCLDEQVISKDLFEIIVINNDPADPIPDGFFMPHNCCIEIEPKPGSYSARNKGVAISRGDILCFTDADCRPDSSWLELILKEFGEQGQGFLLSGKVEMFNSSGRRNLNWAESYDMALGINQDLYWSRGVAATANLSVPRFVFEEVGGFDSKLFSGGDGDFCERSRKKGYPLKYNKDVVVRHPLRSDISQIVLKRKRILAGRLRRKGRSSSWIIFMPPVDRIRIIIGNRQSVGSKLKAILVVFWLKTIDIKEFCRLTFFKGRAERR